MRVTAGSLYLHAVQNPQRLSRVGQLSALVLSLRLVDPHVYFPSSCVKRCFLSEASFRPSICSRKARLYLIPAKRVRHIPRTNLLTHPRSTSRAYYFPVNLNYKRQHLALYVNKKRPRGTIVVVVVVVILYSSPPSPLRAATEQNPTVSFLMDPRHRRCPTGSGKKNNRSQRPLPIPKQPLSQANTASARKSKTRQRAQEVQKAIKEKRDRWNAADGLLMDPETTTPFGQDFYQGGAWGGEGGYNPSFVSATGSDSRLLEGDTVQEQIKKQVRKRHGWRCFV